MRTRLLVGAAALAWTLGCGGGSGNGAPAPAVSPSPSPSPSPSTSPVPTATPTPQPTTTPAPAAAPAPASPEAGTESLDLDANGVLRAAFEIRTGNFVDGPLILGESGRAYWREFAPEGQETWLVSANPDGTVRYRVPIDRAWGFTGAWMRAFDLLVAATIEDCAPGGQRLEARRALDGAIEWTTRAGAVFAGAARTCSTFGTPALAGSSIVVRASTCDPAMCDDVLAWIDARTGAVQRLAWPRQGRTTAADGAASENRGSGAAPAVDAAGNVYVTVAGSVYTGSHFEGSQLVSYGPDGTERYRVSAPGLPWGTVAAAGLVVVNDSMGPPWIYRAADGGVVRRDSPIVPWVLMRDGLFGIADAPRAEPDGFTYDASGAAVFAVQLPGSGVYDAGSALGDGILWTFERQSDRRRTGIVRGFRLPGRAPATSGRFTFAAANMARDNAER